MFDNQGNLRDAWNAVIEKEQGFLEYCDCCEQVTYHELQFVRTKKSKPKGFAEMICAWCGYVEIGTGYMTKNQFGKLSREIIESKTYEKIKGHLYLVI